MSNKTDIQILIEQFGELMQRVDILENKVGHAPSETKLIGNLEWGPDEGDMTWDAAVKLAASKGDGWRLPTVAELVSQYDYNNGNPAAGFRRTWYWSSSPYGSGHAWHVNFDAGSVDCNARGYENGVRCVRDAKK